MNKYSQIPDPYLRKRVKLLDAKITKAITDDLIVTTDFNSTIDHTLWFKELIVIKGKYVYVYYNELKGSVEVISKDRYNTNDEFAREELLFWIKYVVRGIDKASKELINQPIN